MKKTLRGFVLLSVLIFLQIFFLLGAYWWFLVINESRINQAIWRRQKQLTAAKMMLFGIESNLSSKVSTCMIPIISANELITKSIFWWQQFSCSGILMGIQYYYGIEKLGMANCSFIKKYVNNQVLTAEYYRISLSVPDKIEQGESVLLQSTYVIPGKRLSHCQQSAQVTEGRQMLRELVMNKFG